MPPRKRKTVVEADDEADAAEEPAEASTPVVRSTRKTKQKQAEEEEEGIPEVEQEEKKSTPRHIRKRIEQEIEEEAEEAEEAKASEEQEERKTTPRSTRKRLEKEIEEAKEAQESSEPESSSDDSEESEEEEDSEGEEARKKSKVKKIVKKPQPQKKQKKQSSKSSTPQKKTPQKSKNKQIEQQEEEEAAPARSQANEEEANEREDSQAAEEEATKEEGEQKVSQASQPGSQEDEDAFIEQPASVRKKKRLGSDGYAEAGIIKEVILKRFMNHEHLRINFGENINFVYGENGTGKSAILVGLQTCLGSTTKDTARAGSLKGLIKHGHKEAEISVTIKNQGSDAFDHDSYGDQITVVRRITPTSSTYKILAANGKTVSSNKKTMQEISAHFKIQVSNPCVVMTQEDAKEFLTGRKKGGVDKYQFFLRATMLDQMIDYVTESQEKSDAMKASISTIEARMSEKAAQLQQYEQAYVMSKKMEDMLKMVVGLKDEKVWARVRQSEQEAEHVKTQMCELSDRVDKYEVSIRTLEEREKRSASEVKELKDNLDSAHQTVEESEKVLGEGQKMKKLILKQIDKLKREIKEFQEKMGRVQKRKEQQTKLIATLKQENSRDLEQEERERQAKIHEQLEQLRNDRKTQERLEEDIKQAEAQDLSSKINVLKQEEEELNRKVSKCTSTLYAIKQNRSDPLAPFGPHATMLKQEIEKCEEFSVRPLGPIGAHIKLKDKSLQQWLGPIERCLQHGFIKSYLVDNQEDLAILKDLFKKTRGLKNIPDIVQAKRSEKNYEVKLLQVPNATTVYESLLMENPWISNIVVDRTGCERQLLMENQEEAYEVSKARSDVKNVYLLNCAQVTNKSGAISFVPAHGDTRPRFIGVDAEQQIQSLENEQDELKAKQERVVEVLKDMSKKDREVRHTYDKLCKQREAIVKQIGQRSRALKDLEDKKVENEDDNLVVYMEELQGFNNELGEIQATITEREHALAEITDQYEKAQKEETAQQEARRIAVENHAKSTEALRAFIHHGGGQFKQMIKKAQDKCEEAKQLLSDKQRECARLEHLVEEHTKLAMDLQPVRVETSRSVKEIEVKIVQYEMRISTEKTRRGNEDLQTIQNRYFEAKKANDKDKADLIQLKANHTHLQEAIKERETMNSKFRRMVARETREMFNELLNSQGHAGDIVISHADRSLTFDVVPNALESASQGDISDKTQAKDTKALSGGERSYATLAFVMALCESIQAPFRAMDEFDVFMDPVNRRLSMKMLIQTAERLKHRQFIFITPQDISSVPSGRNIRIHKLQAPIRGQTTLR